MNIDSLEFMREAGRVRRFHCFTTLLPDPVGHHTFNLIGILIYAVPGGPSAQLMTAAYVHDLPERHTGDIPAPFKRSVHGLRDAMEAEEGRLLEYYDVPCPALSEQEQKYLKLADSLDGMYHCLEERRLGNTTLDKVFNTFRRYVEELLDNTTAERVKFAAIARYINRQWELSNGPFLSE